MEQLGVSEKKRRIPAKQDKARDQVGVRIARYVMVALDTIDAAKHRVVRAPAIPEEFDDDNHDGHADTRNRAEHGDADQAHDGQPELPALDEIDSPQVPELEQADGR